MNAPAPYTPLTQDEATSLLQVAATYDNRNIDAAMANSWRISANEARWTYELAERAIRAHYAEQTSWIMPGHVTQWIRNERRKPEQFQAAGELEAPRSTSAGREAAMRLFVSMVGKEIPA